MATYQIATADGKTLAVEGKRFAHYVGGIRYWFLIHSYPGERFPVVSELSTGRRLGSISYTNLAAACNDTLLAAKCQLANLLESRGPEAVRRVIDAAPKITDKWST